MTSKISKKFGQFKQWTGERLGTEHRTEPSDSFKNLTAETEVRKQGLEDLYEALIIFLKTFEKKRMNVLDTTKAHPLEVLGSCMMKQGRMIGVDTNYGMWVCLYFLGGALVKSGELVQKLFVHELKFYSDAKRSFLAQIEQMLSLLREYQSLKKKLSNRRLDYDAKLNKLNKSKKENPSRQMEVSTLQSKYEETMSELEKLMDRIRSVELDLSNGLYLFIEALSVYYKESTLVMEGSKDEIFPNFTPMNEMMDRKDDNDDQDLASSLSSLRVADLSKSNVQLDKLHFQPKSSYPQIENAAIRIKAKYDFVPELESGELPLKQGEMLTLTSKYPGGPSNIENTSSAEENGWWAGKNIRNQSGIFPAAYVEIVSSSSSYDSLEMSHSSIAEEEHPHVIVTSPIVSAPRMGTLSLDPKLTTQTSTYKNLSSLDISASKLSTTDITNMSVPVCYVCGCAEFVKNVFKKDSCNNCFHKHSN